MSWVHPLREIVTTEATYVAALHVVVEHYLRAWPEKYVEDRATIFGNLEAIASLHEDMLEGFEAADGNPSLCAVVFTHHAAFLRIYIDYCNQFDEASARLKKLQDKTSIAAFLDKQKEASQKGGLDLCSLLIMPIQRIPRYGLLLREVCKNMDAAEEGFAEMGNALATIEKIALEINEAKRLRESADQAALGTSGDKRARAQSKVSPRRTGSLLMVGRSSRAASVSSEVEESEESGVGTPVSARKQKESALGKLQVSLLRVCAVAPFPSSPPFGQRRGSLFSSPRLSRSASTSAVDSSPAGVPALNVAAAPMGVDDRLVKSAREDSSGLRASSPAIVRNARAVSHDACVDAAPSSGTLSRKPLPTPPLKKSPSTAQKSPPPSAAVTLPASGNDTWL